MQDDVLRKTMYLVDCRNRYFADGQRPPLREIACLLYVVYKNYPWVTFGRPHVILYVLSVDKIGYPYVGAAFGRPRLFSTAYK